MMQINFDSKLLGSVLFITAHSFASIKAAFHSAAQVCDARKAAYLFLCPVKKTDPARWARPA